MNKADTRKKYLRFTSRLYEIASEFDESFFIEIDSSVDFNVNPAVRRAARSLLMLMADPRKVDSRDSVSRKISHAVSGDSLTEFFQTRELFPTSFDISASLPFKLDVKPKESRDRYVKRLVAFINKLSPVEKIHTIEIIQKKVSSKMGSGFVTNWSKLIRGL